MGTINFKKRPLSWSQISSFEYDPEQWYSKYILNEEQSTNAEMTFGKLVADSFGTDKPLAPVTIYPVVEHKLEVVFGDIHMIGFMDTYDPTTHNFREYKTSKKPWTQARANEHGQLKMYALMLYVTHNIKPEKYTIHLDNILTKQNGDFSMEFVEPIKVYTFQVRLTMRDILEFGAHIVCTVNNMEEYVRQKQSSQEVVTAPRQHRENASLPQSL